MINLKKVFDINSEWESNSIRLKAVLSDLYPNNKRDINLLVNVKECGIADNIKALTRMSNAQLMAFAAVINDEYGIQIEYAIEAIKTWTEAYDVEVEKEAITPVDSRMYYGESIDLEDEDDEDYDEYECEIEEQSSLDVYIDDYKQTKSLKSCCCIIDICYQYAIDLEKEYTKATQDKYFKICEKHLQDLIKMRKKGKVEEYYTPLAQYVLGNLYYFKGDLAGAIKCYKEASEWKGFEGCEEEWPDDRIELKQYIHLNMYYIYQVLGIDSGMRAEERVIPKIIEPDLNYCIRYHDELGRKIKMDPSFGLQKFEIGNDGVGSSTNQSMYEFYSNQIVKYKNWKQNPTFYSMKITFSDYDSFVILSLGDAVYPNKWGGVSVTMTTEEMEIDTSLNRFVLKDQYSFDGEVILFDNISEAKRLYKDKIRLLYLK